MCEDNLMKTNAQAVSDYHKQLKDIKIRIPGKNEDMNIPDYVEIFKKQAKLTGRESLNGYILGLIENDIRTNPDGLNIPDFEILRGMRDLKK